MNLAIRLLRVAGRAFRKRNRPLPESAMKRGGRLCGGTNWLKFSFVTDTTEHGKRKAHKHDGRASVRDMVVALAATIPRRSEIAGSIPDHPIENETVVSCGRATARC